MSTFNLVYEPRPYGKRCYARKIKRTYEFENGEKHSEYETRKRFLRGYHSILCHADRLQLQRSEKVPRRTKRSKAIHMENQDRGHELHRDENE